SHPRLLPTPPHASSPHALPHTLPHAFHAPLPHLPTPPTLFPTLPHCPPSHLPTSTSHGSPCTPHSPPFTSSLTIPSHASLPHASLTLPSRFLPHASPRFSPHASSPHASSPTLFPTLPPPRFLSRFLPTLTHHAHTCAPPSTTHYSSPRFPPHTFPPHAFLPHASSTLLSPRFLLHTPFPTLPSLISLPPLTPLPHASSLTLPPHASPHQPPSHFLPHASSPLPHLPTLSLRPHASPHFLPTASSSHSLSLTLSSPRLPTLFLHAPPPTPFPSTLPPHALPYILPLHSPHPSPSLLTSPHNPRFLPHASFLALPSFSPRFLPTPLPTPPQLLPHTSPTPPTLPPHASSPLPPHASLPTLPPPSLPPHSPRLPTRFPPHASPLTLLPTPPHASPHFYLTQLHVFVVSSMVVLFFLPLLVLVVLYWRIARQLLLEDKQLCKDKPNPNLQARKQVVVMLGTVVVVFFVCLLPHRVFSLWFIFTTKESEQSLGQEVYYNLLYAFRILVYFNSAINPVGGCASRGAGEVVGAADGHQQQHRQQHYTHQQPQQVSPSLEEPETLSPL
ncbi:Neuromedin-U receptor 2-like, partial [Homarus americanus]